MADKSAQIAKLVIRSYDKNDFKKENKDRLFTTPINPESFTKNYKVELDRESGHGQPSTNPQYISSAPKELKIDFVLDGTKTVEGYDKVDQYSKLSVHDQLEQLLKCTHTVVIETHRPPFLRVQWGTEIDFNCVLSSLDVNHTLFNTDGSPLRVKVSMSFTHYQSPEERARKNETHSPDLTHYRMVNQGDTLALLTYQVYSDTRYFLQVGRLNDLTSVRKLKPGFQIYLPPLDKT